MFCQPTSIETYQGETFSVEGTFLESLIELGRYGSFATGNQLDIDFDNDGVTDELVELQFSSGGRRACSFTYFEIVDKSWSGFESSDRQQLLLDMQGIESVGGFPGNCGGSQRKWFRFNGINYLEDSTVYTDPRYNNSQSHVIRYIKDGSIHNTCEFRFSIKTSVD